MNKKTTFAVGISVLAAGCLMLGIQSDDRIMGTTEPQTQSVSSQETELLYSTVVEDQDSWEKAEENVEKLDSHTGETGRQNTESVSASSAEKLNQKPTATQPTHSPSVGQLESFDQSGEIDEGIWDAADE